MSSYSKSLFTNNTVFSNTRSLINPISFAIAVQTIGTGTSQELEFLTQYYIDIIRLIQTDYSSKIANQTYEAIPTDFSQYTNLIKEVQDMRAQTTNSSVLLLLRIAEDTLRGAFNSLSLYSSIGITGSRPPN